MAGPDKTNNIGHEIGDATRAVHAGRTGDWSAKIVNTPIYRGSTHLHADCAALTDAGKHNNDGQFFYGRRGSPTQWALAQAITELEPGAYGTMLYPSGVAALSGALMSVLSAGDVLLMTDNAYDPSRGMASGLFRRMGVETRFFDPLDLDDYRAKFCAKTRAVLLESPGSLTMEMCDIPALAKIAREHGATSLLDNTWATALGFPALQHGCDIAIMSLTKHIGGHSDLLMGSASAGEQHYKRLRQMSQQLGHHVSPDDAALALRGLRTMPMRLKRTTQTALDVAQWLASRPEVAHVLCPFLPQSPDYELWQRDYQGGCGLFSFVLAGRTEAQRCALIDALKLFGIGFSWGGFESLALPFDPAKMRSETPWPKPGWKCRRPPWHSPLDRVGGFARFDRRSCQWICRNGTPMTAASVPDPSAESAAEGSTQGVIEGGPATVEQAWSMAEPVRENAVTAAEGIKEAVSSKSEAAGSLLETMDNMAVSLGTMRLSVLDVLVVAAILIGVIVGAWMLNRLARAAVKRLTKLDGAQQLLVEKLLTIAVWGAAVFIGIDLLGIDLTALTVFSGAFGLAIGFGLQKTFGNLIAGIILLMDRSIKPGDVIAVTDMAGNESFGQIRKIGIRAVSVTTRDQREYLIPNENLMINQVENWSYSSKNVRMQVDVGVSYNADLELAEKLMLEAAGKVDRVLKSPPPTVWLSAYGDSSVNFTVQCWILDPEDGVGNVRSGVLKELWKLFKENDVEIPFPQRDINLRGNAQFDQLVAAISQRVLADQEK